MLVENNQTLFDVALNATGSIENIMTIALANNISICDMPIVGNSPILPANISNNKNTLHYLQQNNITIATRGSLFKNGIGYWRIGLDFLIA